ncbi:MAG: ABC transporter ATP-binding protein [Solirubrobacteraceae bacterium]
MLRISGLVKHYRVGDDEPIRAIDGVSLSIEAGEFVALYGPSGSGKSTLIDLIAGFQAPDRGGVVVDDRDISTFTEREHADYLLNVLGIVGQPSDLRPGALARENAALKLVRTDPRNATRRVEPLLRQLGLGERLKHRTSKLSMGERQRVMIAQALSTNPKLVLADEPTGNLDTQRSREILGLLRDLCRERELAVLLATHDPQAVAYADRAHELRDGRLHEYDADDVYLPVREALAES